MAIEVPGFQYSFPAGEDLSSAQFTFVKLDASGNVVKCSAVTDKPVGVLQNNPANGGTATVMLNGISKIDASAALTIDTLVATDANGKAAAAVPGTDTTKYIVGRVIVASAADGEKASIIFSCMGIGGMRGA